MPRPPSDLLTSDVLTPDLLAGARLSGYPPLGSAPYEARSAPSQDAQLPRLAPPLFLCRVEAGFPSPADDHLDGRLDLNEHLVRKPGATFFITVSGHSMQGAGIFDGDLLVVDRSLEARDGHVVIATVYGDLTVKYLRKRRGRVWLEAAHPHYEPIYLHDPEDTGIWGVVTHSIRQHA